MMRSLSPREEKLKEQLNGCGLEKVAVDNVTLGNKGAVYMVNGAVLYKVKNSNSYILFGEPVNYTSILEKLKNKSPEELKKLFAESGVGAGEETKEQEENSELEEEKHVHGESCNHFGAVESQGVVNENELGEDEPSASDVDLIMKEAKISKEEAVKALIAANNDVIQALVDLNKK